jgi:F0F1-type ATP synthase membrane subunit b/b'
MKPRLEDLAQDAIADLEAERDELAAQLRTIKRNASKAGKARWKGITKAQRSQAMRKAVLARWSRVKPSTQSGEQ